MSAAGLTMERPRDKRTERRTKAEWHAERQTGRQTEKPKLDIIERQ